MLKLYHCIDARSFRALWALEELGLAYTLEMLPFPPRALCKPYLDVNPLGTVPLLIDGNTRLTESAAICHYLAAIAPSSALNVLPAEDGFAPFLNALYQSDATLTFPQTLVLRYGELEPAERRQPQVVEDYRRWFHGRMKAIDAILANHEYLAADRFTVADIAVGYALKLAGIVGLSIDFSPRVQAYWNTIAQRDGYIRAENIQKKGYEDMTRSPLDADCN